MIRRILTTGLAAGLALTALTAVAPTSASASGYALPCSGYLDPYGINVPGLVNCWVDAAGNLIIRIGECTFLYDPLFPPFGSQVVPQTVNYVNCIA